MKRSRGLLGSRIAVRSAGIGCLFALAACASTPAAFPPEEGTPPISPPLAAPAPRVASVAARDELETELLWIVEEAAHERAAASAASPIDPSLQEGDAP